MAKFNINFNDKNYEIPSESLTNATNDLKSHLSTAMSGSGATIELGGVAYNIDSTKLSTAMNSFVEHLGTIAGNGKKVTVNGIEYSVDSNKVSGAVSELEGVFGELENGTEPELGFPISWNTMEVVGNASFEGDGLRFVKVSNYVPSAYELSHATITIYHPDEPLMLTYTDGFQFSNCELALYGEVGCFSVSVAGECAELGVTFAETGCYIMDLYTVDGLACDCTIDLASPDTPTEERLEGDGAEFYTLAPAALSFRSTAPLNELQEIQINGVTVDPSNYTLEEGSTIVTFPIEYLKTLNVGNYEVAVASDSKTVKGGFNVVAPELNEHGFYYNQPYSAYVEYFCDNTTFFIREDGTIDVTVSGEVETCPYTISGNSMTVTTSGMGDVHLAISADGIECIELATNFVINDEYAVADEDYIYIYKEDLGGYEVKAIDKTKTEYGAIKTGINGIDTVALAKFAFEECYSLTNIIIPDSIISIGERAFENCFKLASIIIPDNVKNIDSAAFGGCSSLTNVVIGANVIDICAFEACSSLTNVVIGANVKNIDSSAFNRCSNIRLIEVDKNNTVYYSVGNCLIESASKTLIYGNKYSAIPVDNSVTIIGNHAFSHRDGLTSVIIPNGITSIGNNAFSTSTSLTNITIPDSVTSIGDYAFYGCLSLASINFEGTVEQWNAITKGSNWNSSIPATHVTCSDGTVAL